MGLPGAFSGILWMLLATHTTFNVPSLMGTIMCIGVATSNSILLITFANDQRLEEGANAFDAALAAGATRLRPVLMTALAMILGMIPMSLGLGEGGEQNAPLGRAVIGGLLLATATTLFFVPVMYSILRNKDLVPVSEEDAELLFEKDEPEYQMAKAAPRTDRRTGTGRANRNRPHAGSRMATATLVCRHTTHAPTIQHEPVSATVPREPMQARADSPAAAKRTTGRRARKAARASFCSSSLGLRDLLGGAGRLGITGG